MNGGINMTTSGATQKYIKNKGYESIKREMLQNDDLSLEARGLLAYMESMPESYVFHKTQLQRAFKHNKRTCIDRIWNELMSQNYLIAFRKREGKKYIYQYYFTQEKFDEDDIQAIESDLLSSGFERVPLIERKSRNLVATQKYPLISEQSTELLSKFGKDGLKLISKIYESKRKVEKEKIGKFYK